MKKDTKETLTTLGTLLFWCALAGFLFVYSIDKIMLFTSKFR